MNMILKRVFFVLHLGVILPLTEGETVYAIAGKPYTLPCQNNYGTEESVVWKYGGHIILRFNGGHPFKTPSFSAYELQRTEKGMLNLVIPKAVEGIYTCEVNNRITTFHLRVLTATRSHDGYLLDGETLQLKLNFPDKNPIKKIVWYNPHKAQVNGNNRLTLKDNNCSLHIMNLHFREDNGTWECHIPGLNITYDVKVIGFKNTQNAEVMYVAVNSTVNISYPLNVNLRDVPGISEIRIRKLTKDNPNDLKMSTTVNPNSTIPFKEIRSVQFMDGGQYQCQLRLSQRTLNKSIHLVVMKVTAQPLQLNSTEVTINLCCYISALSDPLSQLNWVHMNRTTEHYSERGNTFCITTSVEGLWKCSLLVNEQEKIAIDYVVAIGNNSAKHNTFPVVTVVVGVLSPLLLLILTGTCVLFVRKRQQAKRMIQAKEHLLAKRTCQCQKELTNDYYNA